jgi:uncharacterized protein (TIGR03435 family)
MKNTLKSVFAACAVAALCVAQINESNIPHFEVASVKPSSSRVLNGAYTYPGGRVAFRGCTFLYLVQLAFDLQEFQIAGQADWMKDDFDRFDIDATVPPGSKSSSANPAISKTPMNDEQRRMLQSLLAERFGLRYRQDTTEGAVYFLTRNGKALKIADAKDKNAYPWSGSPAGGMITATAYKASTNRCLIWLSGSAGTWVARCSTAPACRDRSISKPGTRKTANGT